MTEDAYADEVLRRDVFPAEVALPDGSVLAGVRVFVTSHRLLAYQASEGRIALAYAEGLETPYSVPADRNTLRAGQLECKLDVGGTAWVNRGRGCGCGSPLKAMGSPVPWARRRQA